MNHLITADHIKESTVASLSIDAHKLEVFVPLAEGKHLKPLLGLSLFSELVIAAQTPPLAGAMLELATECVNMLSWWTVVEAWPSLLVHVTNAGVVVKTGGQNGTTTADATVTAAALQAHMATAEFYTGELRAWLYEHRADYASYPQPAPARKSSMPLGGVQF
jgi:hypothetical protein